MRTLVVGLGNPILGDDGAGWRVAFGFRACDPCFGCATRSLPGQMSLQVTIRDAEGEVVEVLKQNC